METILLSADLAQIQFCFKGIMALKSKKTQLHFCRSQVKPVENAEHSTWDI